MHAVKQEKGGGGVTEGISRWVSGTLEVKLTGYSAERFFNLCNARQIPVWNLHYQDDGYVFCMTRKGFLQIRPLVRKSQVRLRVRKRMGLPFFAARNRKRIGFGSGIGLFFLFLYLMSLFVWA